MAGNRATTKGPTAKFVVSRCWLEGVLGFSVTSSILADLLGNRCLNEFRRSWSVISKFVSKFCQGGHGSCGRTLKPFV